MTFDRIIEKNGIEYGIIDGSDKLFFIKVGNGGGIYEYENRYLKMSERIHEIYGCSVLVSSNPVELNIRESIVMDMAFINGFFSDITEINAFGHSNGGQMLVFYAYTYPIIRNVLAVNAPLIINPHRTKEGIERFAGNKIHMVYGE